MNTKFLNFFEQPETNNTRMVIGFSGWMDGGEVSTGTVEYLAQTARARPLAEIETGAFSIYNFPGDMELAAMLRPHTRIEDGLVTSYESPVNTFAYDEENQLILFEGKEPHVRWKAFAESILGVVTACNVQEIYFVGSVASLVPHTREPRFFGSVSAEEHKPLLKNYNLIPSNYEGPASFTTYLYTQCRARGILMMSIVAETPAYVQGRNVRCIRASVDKLGSILGLELDTDPLRKEYLHFDEKLHRIVQSRPDLAQQIQKMEEAFDKENYQSQSDELKAWFERQDIQLD